MKKKNYEEINKKHSDRFLIYQKEMIDCIKNKCSVDQKLKIRDRYEKDREKILNESEKD